MLLNLNSLFIAVFAFEPLTGSDSTWMEVRRAHRPTVRGLASRLKSADKVERDAASTGSNYNEDCQVYSKRVEEVFKSVPIIPFAEPSTSGLSPGGLH